MPNLSQETSSNRVHTLNFDEKIKYLDNEQGINLDVIISKQTANPVSATVKLDKGSFTAFGHEIIIRFSNLEWEAFVYFAQDESFPVSVLGRNGFLNKINIAIIDYEQLLYLKSYI